MKSKMMKVQLFVPFIIAFLLVIITVFTGCGEAGSIPRLTATPTLIPTSTPTTIPTLSPTPTLIPTSTPTTISTLTLTPTLILTSTPTPTPIQIPLHAPGWEGVMVRSLRFVEQQSYPELRNFSRPIDETVQDIMGRLGIQIVGKGMQSDATITFAVTVEAKGEFYTSTLGGGSSGYRYSGAWAYGQLVLAMTGRTSLTFPVEGTVEPPHEIRGGYTNPSLAPFDEVLIAAFLDGLSRLWGAEGLMIILRHNDARIHRHTSVALENLGQKSVSLLIQALGNDKDSYIREAAAKILGNIGNPRSGINEEEVREAIVPSLIRALKDDDFQVRSSAAQGLQKIGTQAKEAVPALIQALRDDDFGVRSSAKESLMSITGKFFRDATEWQQWYDTQKLTP
jgi:hypothetical protein